MALRQLADGLGIAPESVFAVELDTTRGDKCRENNPGANVLAPASYFGTEISSRSFSAIYVNSPFSEDLQGSRVEIDWLSRCTPLLAPGGIILQVLPESVAARYDYRRALSTFYTNIRAMPFPAHCRKYGEIFVAGVKRDTPLTSNADTGWLEDWLQERWTYTLPAGTPPKVWRKTAMTDEELEAAMDASALNKLLDVAEEKPLPSPPLALGLGHICLLLASGLMGGYVEAGKDSHVVRGTARKVEEVSDESTETTESRGVQTVKTTTTLTERIKLVVRTVDRAGFIQSLS